MISSGINYFYDFLGLDQSNFKIFYDFTSGSITGGNKIGSIPSGKAQYSGSATSITSLNSSGVFSGSRTNLIKIENVVKNDFLPDYSLIFKFNSPAPQSSILFSSLTGSNGVISGFNIGINYSNYLYLEYYDNNSNIPVILTSQSRLSDTNIVTANISPTNVSLGYFNPASKRIESEDFIIESDCLPFSNHWHLGGGIMTGVPPQDFSGYYGAFLGFNTSLSKNTMTRLISGFYSYPVYPSGSGAPAIVIDGPLASQTNYDSVIYMGRNISGSTEIYNYTGNGTVNYLNKFGSLDAVNDTFSADSFYSSGDCNVFLNGLLQVESGFNTTETLCGEENTAIADFYLSNQYFNFKEDLVTNDVLIYDNNNLQNRIIYNYSGETGFQSFGRNLLFANGQKLISGEDYSISGSSFFINISARSAISGANLLLISGKQDFQRFTGQKNIFNKNKFLPKTTTYYLNGIRQPTNYFMEYSHLAPLSGDFIFAENLSLVNNNEIDDWS